MVQLVERSLPMPEIRGSNPVNDKFDLLSAVSAVISMFKFDVKILSNSLHQIMLCHAIVRLDSKKFYKFSQ